MKILESKSLDIEGLNSLKKRAENNKKYSSKYRFLDTVELIETISGDLSKMNIDHDVNIVQSTKQTSSTLHLVQFELKKTMEVAFADSVQPQILIANSYNREGALTTNVGMFRMVCTNGLIAGDSMFKAKVPHLLGQSCENKLQIMRDRILQTVAFIEDELLSKVSGLVDIETNISMEANIIKSLSDNGTLSPVVASACYGKRLSTDPKDGKTRMGLREEDDHWNLWTLYNVINEEMKNNSPSEIGFYKRNVKLMDLILDVAKAA